MSYEKSTLNWYFIIKVYMFGHLSFFLMIQNFFYWTYLHFLLVTFESIVVIDLFHESFKRTKKIIFSCSGICCQGLHVKMSKENHNPYQKEDHFGRGVTASQKATIRAFDKFYSWFPSFLDVFPDEDAWLNFVFWFVLATIVVAVVVSRYIVIKPHML